jgi:hypothetical protein
MKVSAERLMRIRAARDHALQIIKNTGRWETFGPLKMLMAEMDDLMLAHRTPFSPLPDREATCPSYQHALAEQAAAPDLPYAIDVWFKHKKVLFVQWDQNDELQVISFRPGEWDARLAAACGGNQ